MITRFEIANYKSIKKLMLDFQPFMVLVGPNGAGKTNVVQALKLFGDLLSRGTTDPAQEQGWSQIVHRQKRPARGGLKLSGTFLVPRVQIGRIGQHVPRGAPRGDDIEVQVSLVIRGSTAGHEITVVSEELRVGPEESGIRLSRRDDSVDIDRGSDKDLWRAFARYSFFLASHSSEAPQTFSVPVPADPQTLTVCGRLFLGWLTAELVKQSATTRLRLDTSALRNDARFDLVSGRSIGPSGEGLPVAVDKLRGRGAKPAAAFLPILAALREVYPRIEDVRPEPFAQGRVTLLFQERGISDPIPLDSISDGVIHALALLIALQSPGPGILAIEEPENALHPWSVRKILERAQSGDEQRVLMTTHSETVVNAVADPDSLFIVEGDEDTGTTVTPATNKEKALRAILMESGQQLGDVWLDGTLGGVPS